MAENQPFDVAVVGGGIVGLILTLGLLRRGIPVKIYEQSSSFHEIGAGVAFTANAQRCMELLDPNILQSMKNVASKNPHDYYRYVVGYSNDTSTQAEEEELLFQIYAGKAGFDGCHRAHFLDELVRFLPTGVVEFRKRLDTYIDRGEHEKVLLKFADGTTAEADVVVGCDGIKSRVRQTMFGAERPISHAHYTHKVAFRGLIPMEHAIETLGREKAMNQCMHMGPKAHVLNFPVAMHTMINVVAFVDDPNDWPVEEMSVIASREEVTEAFSNWNPAVCALLRLLPDELTKWAIFDMYDHPAPSYSQGRVCLAGDAAHASSPHHGAGAGFGVEDALALATVLDKVQKSGVEKGRALQAALEAYSSVRLERSQWLVQSSREVCEVYELAYEGTGNEPEKCKQEIEWRAHRIWYFDIDRMLQGVQDEYQRRLDQ